MASNYLELYSNFYEIPDEFLKGVIDDRKIEYQNLKKAILSLFFEDKVYYFRCLFSLLYYGEPYFNFILKDDIFLTLFPINNTK